MHTKQLWSDFQVTRRKHLDEVTLASFYSDVLVRVFWAHVVRGKNTKDARNHAISFLYRIRTRAGKDTMRAFCTLSALTDWEADQRYWRENRDVPGALDNPPEQY